MTKSQGAPSSSTGSSFLEKRRYDRVIPFNQLPLKDVPLYQQAERVQWDEWVTHGSVKIHPPVEAEKLRQQVPRGRRLHSRFACRNKNAGLLDPSGGPMPVKAKARLVIQGQHCLDNAQSSVKTDAPTVHRTAVSVFLPVVAMGWCRSLRGVDVSCAFPPGKLREIQDHLFSEPPARGSPGVEKGSLTARLSAWLVERTS